MGAFEYQPWFLKAAGRGGPVGELIQWTDLIVGLYVLGYNVEIYLERKFLGYFSTLLKLKLTTLDLIRNPLSAKMFWEHTVYVTFILRKNMTFKCY